MSGNRSSIIRGPGALTLNTSTTLSTTTNSIQFKDDFSVKIKPANEAMETALQGTPDETRRDLIIVGEGTPEVYTASQSTILNWICPWANAFPSVGAPLMNSSTDFPVFFMANNGDGCALYNTAVAEPPDLTLSIRDPIIDKLRFIALIRNGYDPETAFSYYKLTTGGSWTQPKLGQQSGDLFGRQRYLSSWPAGNTATGNSTFTNFEAYEKIIISQEVKLEPWAPQGRTRGYTLKSYRAMARFVGGPVGPSASDIDTCLQAQGTGAIHGSRISQNTAMGTLTMTGQIGGTFAIPNAVMVDDSFWFGNKPLRQGEIGFVGTLDYTTTSPTGGLNLS